MDYASPFVQLIGVVCSILIWGLAIFASVLLLREKSAGAWLMLAGSVLAFLGTAVPQGLYAMENFVARYSGSMFESEMAGKVQSLMYFTVWDWLSTAASLLFVIGLALVALRRRGLANRIKDLETLLAARNSQGS